MRYLIAILLLIGLQGHAQDPSRFSGEVQELRAKYDTIWDSHRETIVFTGSSSIRFWKNLPELFPVQQIVNTGFGGSQTSDLIAYSDDLILRFKPIQVFIYEGDNDIGDAKRPRQILKDFRVLIQKIRAADPDVGIVLIAAKPSLARWHLKRKYRNLNRKLKRLCRKDKSLEFADVWDIMLKDRRNLRNDIFIEDGLHMNQKGYALWYNLIKNYIN